MELIFFNMEGGLPLVSGKFFKLLSNNKIQNRYSENVLGGEYFQQNFFGLKMKLELNSYDYEDKFGYMVSIYDDALTKVITTDNIASHVTEVVIELLIKNYNIEVGYEKGERLIIRKD